MPTLFDQLNTVTGNIDVSAVVGGEAQKLIELAGVIAQLIDNPPDDFGDYLNLLSELELPDFSVSSDVTGIFDGVRNAIPTDLGDLTGPITQSLGELDTSAVANITGVIEPAMQAIQSLIILLKGDLSCGIFEDFHGGAASAGGGAGGGGAGAGDGAGAGAGIEPQNPAVSQDQIDQAKAVLDLLPTPLTVESLLRWFVGFIGSRDLPYAVIRSFPIIDDLRSPIATIVNWADLDGNGILAQFADTLTATAEVVEQNTTAYLTQASTDLTDMLTPLDLPQLGTIADDLIAHFDTIAQAVTANDISAIGVNITAINDALALLNTQQLAWSGSVQIPLGEALTGFAQLPAVLEDQIVQLVSLLQPRPDFKDYFGGDEPEVPDESSSDLAAIESLFSNIEQFLENLLDKIDLSAVFSPITTPLNEARNVVEAINQQLVMMTLEVQSKFEQVNGLVDGFDATGLISDAEAAIDDFSGQLQTELTNAFAPVKTALETLMSTISGALGDFDPASIKTEIDNVINAIKAVFEDPTLQAAFEKIGKLKDLADKLGELSFTPVTNTVIEGVDTIKGALESIDESLLQAPLDSMLDAAVAVLPTDLEPITDPLIDELGNIIEAGPIAVLNQIKKIPEQLFDEIRKFDPETLLGDTLSKPYQDLLSKVQDFSPSDLLEEVEGEFDKLKQRIIDNAAPGIALQPLVDLHQQLVTDLAQLQPGDLLEPLDQQIQQALQTVTDNVNLDELLQPLEDAIEQIKSYADLGDKGIELLRHFVGKLNDLLDAPAQLSAWLDSIFAKIPNSIDITPLQAPMEALSDALDNTKSVALQAHFTTAFTPLNDVLTTLNADAKLTQIVQKFTAISRTQVESLPTSSEKTDLLALLDAIQVSSDEFGGVYRQLAQLKLLSVDVSAQLTVTFTGWDEKYHRAGGALDLANQDSVDLTQIKNWIREAIDCQLAYPVNSILSKTSAVKNIINAFVDSLEGLVDALQVKITELLQAPQALLDLKDTVQDLLDDIGNINLDFVQDSLNEIFDTVRQKLNDLNPAALQRALDENFEEILGAIGFDLIIPSDSLQALDEDFDNVIEGLKTLDPNTLLVEPLQEVFEESIQPLIDSLDVTPLLEAVIERLEPLEEELRSEMGRVNTAYQGMLQAVP